MARTSTTKSASTTPAPVVVTETVAPTVVPQETVVTSDADLPKSKKQKKSKTVAEVATPVVEPSPVVPEVVVTEEVVPPVVVVTNPNDELFNGALEKLNDYSKQINDLSVELASLKLNFKNAQKEVVKAIKVAHKLLSKGKKSGVKRSPQGFTKPTLISDELAAFLNKEPGTEIARIAASNEVHHYIKANKLNHGREIHPDATLAKILNYVEGESPVLTYLNIQRFLKHHFISNKVATDVPVTTEVVA
jgi:chromatin remodeling complex protein RSC6